MPSEIIQKNQEDSLLIISQIESSSYKTDIWY